MNVSGINPIEIARRMASALATSESLAETIELYSQNKLSVYMDSIGALQGADVATMAEHLAKSNMSSMYPLCIIGSLQHDDGPVSSGDECQVGIIITIDSAVDAAGNKINAAMPLQADDGVFEVGNANALSEIVESIKYALMTSSVNGIIQTFSTAYNAGEQYPIQSASITVSVKAVNAF